MRYFVELDDNQVPVDLTALPGGGYDIRINGRRVDADVVPLADALSIRIDGRVLDLTVEGKPPQLGISARGRRTWVNVESERYRAASAARVNRAGAAHGTILSPMPGRIVKVLVEVGAVVEAGAPVVVVEAMKMENELRCPQAGTVTVVHVKAGDRVEGNAPLVEIS